MAFLTGWAYRKKITLTGQTGAGTNYQVLLKIGESSGASGENFDLNSHSSDFPNAKNDGGDLRFTSSDETTLLDFWVESVSGATPNRLANVWVEVGSDLGSNQDIYCYYGNASASNGSNGNNTFVLFDDFDGTGNVDSSKWSKTYTSTLMGDSTVMVGGTSGQYNGIYSVDTFGDGYSVITRAYIYGTTIGAHNAGSFGSSTGSGTIVGYQTQWNSPYQLFAYGTGSNSLGSPYDDAYYRFETKRKGNTSAELLVNDTSVSSVESGAEITACPISTWAYQSDYNYVDYIAVRKLIATEPSYNTAGNEEANSPYVKNIKALVVGGGGAGRGNSVDLNSGDGGSAGQYVYNPSYEITPNTYSVTVGAGGVGVNGPAVGPNGGNSVFDSITANGGIGGQGGSSSLARGGGSGAGGAGTGPFANDNGGYAGIGGVGLSNSISGTATYYAGGGGGGFSYGGAGGNGGGGNGESYEATAGTAGAPNTGAGGGGRSNSGTTPGYNGGSGIVILRWTTADFGTCSITGTGNTLDTTTVAGDTIATFIVSGTIFTEAVTGSSNFFNFF